MHECGEFEVPIIIAAAPVGTSNSKTALAVLDERHLA